MDKQEFNVSVVSQTEDFRSLRDSMKSLSHDNFFLSWEWLFSWWEHMGATQAGRELCLIKVEDRLGQLVGLAPFYVEQSQIFGRMLRLLGSGCTCSDFLTLISKPGFEQHVAEATFQVINHKEFTEHFGPINLIELEGHVSNDKLFELFINRSTENGYELRTEALEGCWRVDLTDSWETFRPVIHKSRRRKVNKAFRHFEDNRFKVEYVEKSERLREVWPDFVELHQKRRNQLGQEGCFAESTFETFLRESTVRLMDTGIGLLTMIHFDGKPMGGILCFGSGECLCVYQSGLDTDLAKYEPGHFANTFTIQAAMDRGYRSLDFLRGDEPYKKGWGCDRTELVRTRLIAPRFAAQARHRLYEKGRQLLGWTGNFWKKSTVVVNS